MRKIGLILLALLFSVNLAYAGNQWRDGTSAESIVGTQSPSVIDDDSYEDIVAPLDRLLDNFQEGCQITYATAATLTVGAGEIVLSNSAGTVHLMQQNSSATTVTWADIDTEAEEDDETYYVYAYQATILDTDFDISISKSSSAPTGITYFARLGYFENNSDGDITSGGVTNDNDLYSLQLGDWVSKSNDTSYEALTDGFVVSFAGSGKCYGYSDSSNPPTTRRMSDYAASGFGGWLEMTFPVKEGDYWKVTGLTTGTVGIYWIPLE